MVKMIKCIFGGLIIFLLLVGQVVAQSDALTKIETLILQDCYSEAAGECKKLLVHHHQDKVRAKASYLLGLCQLKENEFLAARENFKIVLRNSAGSKFRDDASLGIADSYFLAGEFAQAESSYVQFMRDFPGSPLVTIARKHIDECKQGRHFSNSYFSVQAGCFSNRQNAKRLRDELIDKGFQGYLLELPGEGLFRVRVGKFSNRHQAESLEHRLKSEGYPTKVCP